MVIVRIVVVVGVSVGVNNRCSLNVFARRKSGSPLYCWCCFYVIYFPSRCCLVILYVPCKSRVDCNLWILPTARRSRPPTPPHTTAVAVVVCFQHSGVRG
ncbi:unnamed protein product [Laminaria digitata]